MKGVFFLVKITKCDYNGLNAIFMRNIQISQAPRLNRTKQVLTWLQISKFAVQS